MQIGDRVGAILSSNSEVVNFLGYGKYDGDIDHPYLGFPNPRITLDNGDTVWGCECWWGPEGEIKKILAGRKVKIVGK